LPKATPIFKNGEFVEYYSRARGGWVNSMVLGKNSDGTYRLDCKQKASAEDLRPQMPNSGALNLVNPQTSCRKLPASILSGD